MREAPHVLGIVLAGGEGKRLYPLTADRAKPAVPFGGAYRLIDFVLSNLVNARYLRICVLTQYKSHSLDRHISQTWRMFNRSLPKTISWKSARRKIPHRSRPHAARFLCRRGFPLVLVNDLAGSTP